MTLPKTNAQAYDVNVHMSDGTSAALIVVTYNVDSTGKFVGLDFYRIAWTIDDSKVPDPGYNAFNFQQELRLLSRGVATFTGPRSDEGKVIEAKMKEAYGPDAQVVILSHKTKQHTS